MNFIKKIFIKDYQHTEKARVRFLYGIVAGVFGIISNLILFALKITVGMIGNSITIIADAINNLSDCGSSIVTIVGFKLSARPADKEHPYGHARYEYITALIVAFIVLAIGLLLGKSSIEKIIAPQITTVSFFTYIVLAISILVKVWQLLLYRNFGKSIGSDALIATGMDSRNDIITTTAVLISTIIIATTGVNIDGYMGLAVSIFIFISSIKLVRDTINPLLGARPEPELVDKIKQKILSYEGIIGMHDLMIHSYGARECFVIVHAEVPANADFLTCHDLMDMIERDFKEEMGINLSIHMDPIEVDNEAVNALRLKIYNAIHNYNNTLDMHDFRVVFGKTHTNILFDVVIPYECKVTRAEVIEVAQIAVAEEGVTYFFIVDVDKSFAI